MTTRYLYRPAFPQATDYLLRQPSYLLGGNLLGLGGAIAGALGGEQDDLARALAMSLGENVMVSTDATAEGGEGKNREDQVSPSSLVPWAVVVAQLVERSLPIPEVRSSNPVIGKNLLNIYFLSTVLKRRK